MDDMPNYLEKLERDLLEQFRGKPNIEKLHVALARQFTELHRFFVQLNTLRSMKTAFGAQLDGIGDILVLSRMEALIVSKLVNKLVPMDDKTYRTYLTYKLALNTSDCTHKDVHSILKMFWDKSPLYYSEDPAHPATMFFTTPILAPEDNVGELLLAPRIKAAGVAMIIIATTQTPEMGLTIRVGGATHGSIMTTKLAQYSPYTVFESHINVVGVTFSIEETTLKPHGG